MIKVTEEKTQEDFIMFLSILEVESEQLPGLAIVCGDPRMSIRRIGLCDQRL